MKKKCIFHFVVEFIFIFTFIVIIIWYNFRKKKYLKNNAKIYLGTFVLLLLFSFKDIIDLS